MQQRIWIVSELYYPETTSTGYFMTGLAEGLATKYDVHVLCAQPSYSKRGVTAPSREVHGGVAIIRCWSTTLDKNKIPLRLVNLLTISLSIFFNAIFRFRREDVVISVTNPPLLPYMMALACRLRGAKFILRIEDVYPEVLTRLGMLDAKSTAARVMERLSVWLYNSTNKIIALGRDMKVLAQDKLRTGRDRVVITPNWGDTETVFPMLAGESALRKKLGLETQFVAQYCGNIGRTHGMNELADAAEILKQDDRFALVVIGWGAKRKWLEKEQEQRQLRNLTICDPLPFDQFCDGLNACDVAMITFSPGMSGISVPSRMYNVMASGKPIIAVCDGDSELAAVVREENIGWIVPPGRPDLIVDALRMAQSSPEVLIDMGRRARAAAEAKYTLPVVLQMYEAIVESVTSA